MDAMTRRTLQVPATPPGASADLRGPRFLPSETEIDIRFADVDMMQVVHHAAYLHWFETIRFHLLEDVLGLDFESLRRTGLGFPLLSCEVHYLKPFRFEDAPFGYGRLELYQKAVFSIHYQVYKGKDGPLGVTGKTTHCYLDGGSRLLLRTPEIARWAFRRVVAKYGDCVLCPSGDLDAVL